MTTYVVSFTDSDHDATRLIVKAEDSLKAVALATLEVSGRKQAPAVLLGIPFDVSERTITVEEY